MRFLSLLATFIAIPGAHAMPATEAAAMVPAMLDNPGRVVSFASGTNQPPTPVKLPEVIYNGLHPSHTSGMDEHDALLFRHRFQHHDPEHDILMYYQYEAKRHPHVTILKADDLHACTATGTPDGNVTVHLTLPTGRVPLSKFAAGNIVVASDITCATPFGDLSTLRERVMRAPTVHHDHSGMTQLSMIIRPVSLSDCFE